MATFPSAALDTLATNVILEFTEAMACRPSLLEVRISEKALDQLGQELVDRIKAVVDFDGVNVDAYEIANPGEFNITMRAQVLYSCTHAVSPRQVLNGVPSSPTP